MAIQGFNKSFYLNAKLAQLQANSETAADWAGKDAAFLEARFAAVGLTAEQHYEQYGYKEDLAPNAYFDPAEYIRAKATAMFNDANNSYLTIDAAAQDFVNLWGGNVYNHYLQYGEAEGVNPSNDFDVSSYYDAKLAQLQAAGNTEITTVAQLKASFDAAGLTALEHFIAYGQGEGITAPAVPASEQVNVDTSVPGETFTLTTGIDALSGTANDDTFVANDGASIAAGDTLQLADTINGGAGTDKLSITTDQEGAIPALDTTSVETISIRTSDDDDNNGSSFNAANASGLKTLELDRLTDDFAVTGLSTDVTTSIFNNATGEDISLTYANVTGTSDVASVEVNKLGTTNLVIADGIETVSVKAIGSDSTIAQLDTGANATTLNLNADTAALVVTESDQGADNALKTVNITGSKAVAITNALSTAVTTIDASANTGGFTTTLAGLAAAATVTGGTGNDVLTAINANANTINLGAGNDSVDLNGVVASSTGTIAGGEGTDTLVFGDASATLITSGNKAAFSGFETMKAEVSSDVLDFEALASFVNLELGASTAATVNNISTAAAGSILVSGDQATSTILNIKNATLVGQTNSMTLTLDHTTKDTDIDVTDLQSDGLETLNIVSTGTTTAGNQNSVELGTETNDLTQINISGDSEFALTVQGGANLTGQQTVNGSAATAKLNINLSGDTDGVSITGGSADDIIVAGSGNDILFGGAGKDNITAGDGTATITLGDGADTITILDGDFITANKLTVKDFAVGTDKLDINDATNLVTAGAGDIVGGLVDSELQTASAPATGYTVGGGAAALELAFEFDADVDLDTATAADILSAAGAADNGTSSSKTAANITAAANDDDVLIIAYQDGNAYMFRGQAGATDAAIGDGVGAGDAIDLVGVLEGVAVGSLSAVDFA